jgi:hypothetical protein
MVCLFSVVGSFTTLPVSTLYRIEWYGDNWKEFGRKQFGRIEVLYQEVLRDTTTDLRVAGDQVFYSLHYINLLVNELIIFRDVIAVYSENHIKPISTP